MGNNNYLNIYEWVFTLSKCLTKLNLKQSKALSCLPSVQLKSLSQDIQAFKAKLLSKHRLSTLEIEERAQSLGLFETLKTSPETLHEHMVKYVYPSIEGRDHQRLLYYFTLLENCGCSEVVKHAVKPETHIRLLKKFKAVAPGRRVPFSFLHSCTHYSVLWVLTCSCLSSLYSSGNGFFNEHIRWMQVI